MSHGPSRPSLRDAASTLRVVSDKTELGVIPVASTSFVEEAVLIEDGSGQRLSFAYESGGQIIRGGIKFQRWRAEGHCTPCHIDGAYDTICEVEDSVWVQELLAAQPEHQKGLWVVRHFMIYLDSSGCYEFAAESWSMFSD